MDLSLHGKVAVIVGAASGIGLAVAKEMAQEGAIVCWLDRDPQVATIAQSVHQALGTSVQFVSIVDATDTNGLARVASEIIEKFGRCDHVIVTIGKGSGKFGFPFWNLTPDDWEPVLRVNLVGAVRVAHAFVPHMLPARRGTLCFLSSVAGQIGSQTDPPYSAAKAGLINFAQCAAKDLAPYDIRVNVVCPGMVRTPLNQTVWQAWRDRSPENQLTYDEWAEQKIRQIAPLGRWQETADVAAAIVFLTSDRAKNTTGQTINIDGGQVM